MNLARARAGLLLRAITLLDACSAEGVEVATPPPTGNSNWDSLVWGQGNWT
jgi:hypothetical protein